MADCLRRELRSHDGIGRYGGAEFVVILDQLQLQLQLREAQLVADRLRSAINALPLEHGPHITTSIGIARAEQAVGRFSVNGAQDA